MSNHAYKGKGGQSPCQAERRPGVTCLGTEKYHIYPPWTGLVTVTLTGEFIYEVDETWEARDADHARQQVDQEITDYIGAGGAFVDNRFDETWKVEADNE